MNYSEANGGVTVQVWGHVSGTAFSVVGILLLPFGDRAHLRHCYPWATDAEFAQIMLMKNAPLPLADSTTTRAPRKIGNYLGAITP